MRESKFGMCISIAVTIVSVLVVLFIQEESIIKSVFSVVLDGGFVSTLILVITYYTEERKSLYKFYTAADRYTEIVRRFSQYLADSNVIISKETEEEKRQKTMEKVMGRLEKIYEDLYIEYSVIQEETRFFEAYSIKGSKRDDIKRCMRTLYNHIKIDLECIKICEEKYYTNQLYGDESYEVIKVNYDQLCNNFIRKDELNKFMLRSCVLLDAILNIFISKKIIYLRNDKKTKRNSKYEVSFENNEINDTKKIYAIHEDRRCRDSVLPQKRFWRIKRKY